MVHQLTERELLDLEGRQVSFKFKKGVEIVKVKRSAFPSVDGYKIISRFDEDSILSRGPVYPAGYTPEHMQANVDIFGVRGAVLGSPLRLSRNKDETYSFSGARGACGGGMFYHRGSYGYNELDDFLRQELMELDFSNQ